MYFLKTFSIDLRKKGKKFLEPKFLLLTFFQMTNALSFKLNRVYLRYKYSEKVTWNKPDHYFREFL